MYGLPRDTLYNKRVPKNTFYNQLTVPTAIKRLFVEEIEEIIWLGKLSPHTLHVQQGKRVLEVQVMHVRLRRRQADMRLLKLIDKGIPYPLVFLLQYGQEVQLCAGYKEQAGEQARILAYYQTAWQPAGQVELRIEGLNMDAVYDGLIRQIAGEQLHVEKEQPLKTAVEQQQRRKKLEEQIAALQKKRGREKQFNKQVEINEKIRELKRQLEEV